MILDKYIEEKVIVDWVDTWYVITPDKIYHKANPDKVYTIEELTKEVMSVLNIEGKHYGEVYEYITRRSS